MTKQIRRSWAISKARMAFGLSGMRMERETMERLLAVGITLLLSLAVLVPLSASGADVATISRAMGF
jgi:hypothetical protein